MSIDSLKSIINPNIKKIKKTTSINDIISIFVSENVKIFAIVDEYEKIIGIIDYSILLFILSKEIMSDSYLKQDISKYVTNDILVANLTDGIEDIFGIMVSRKIEYLIVIDDENYPIGYVSIYDLSSRVLQFKNIFYSSEEIELKRDDVIQRLMAEIDTLNAQSTIDPLTGLFNVRYFHKVIEEEANRAIRYGHSISIIFIDCDHFKSVNDKYGHECGNMILKEMGKLLSNSSDFGYMFRKSDISIRYGGEEFVIISPNTNKNQAYILADRIRTAVESKVFFYENLKLRITISIGISEFIPAENKSILDIIKEADTAMYNAKRLGRNRVVIY